MLSVQVHPTVSDVDLLPVGETGKTEAWVVLEAEPESQIYVGLKPGTTEGELRQAISSGDVTDHLVGFTPKTGDAVFIPAGTVHSLGHDVVVFEVQQNSDVTFRLYDWNHVDSRTGQPRALQVEQALACTDFSEGTGGLVTSDVVPSTVEQIIAFNDFAVPAPGLVIPNVETSSPVEREELFHCDHFWLWRLRGAIAIHRRRRGCAKCAGMHRRCRCCRTSLRHLFRWKRRCTALARGGRTMCSSAHPFGNPAGNSHTVF